MSKVRVASFAISLDGFGAGPDQSLENPLGVGGRSLHEWVFPTATFQAMFGNKAGTTGIDNDFAARGFSNIGAWILGRNMFGPVRGPWPDLNWKGWWGDTPPYRVPVFVLTHHPRPVLEMDGGTTFHFVTAGIHDALDRARAAAGGRDVRIGGGPATIRQYLRAGLIDELHVAISPVLLGTGEPLFAGLDMKALGYRCVEHVATEHATHVVLRRGDAGSILCSAADGSMHDARRPGADGHGQGRVHRARRRRGIAVAPSHTGAGDGLLPARRDRHPVRTSAWHSDPGTGAALRYRATGAACAR